MKVLPLFSHIGMVFLFWGSCLGQTYSEKKTDYPPEVGESIVQEIIVVAKTHFDIGYTHKVDELIPYYRTTMIDKALAVMEDSKDLPPEQQFVWTAPAWVLNKVLEDWDGQTPERKAKLEKAFRSERFVPHALPFSSHTDIMSAEEFARGMQFSTRVTQKYDLPMAFDAKLTDVPSHSRVLATGLARAGVKFLHIGCNWPSGSVDYPGLFWWEGPDGAKILTMYSSIYSSCTALWPKDWGGNTGEDHKGMIGTNLLPPKGWPHKTWLAIIVTPDNSGPPSADALKPLFDEVAEKMPGTKIRMGRMQDFADAIIASGATLPIVKKEAPDTWIHGVMSDPGGMKMYRNLQPAISAAEILNTQLQIWKVPVAKNADKFNKASEQMMLYPEHTWGLGNSVTDYGDDFYNQPEGKYSALEESWEDKTDYVRHADSLIRSSLDADLDALAKAVKFNGDRIVVYNPLPWKRSEIVKIPGTPEKYFRAEDIPPSGYRTFSLKNLQAPKALQESSNIIENEYYKIVLDPDQGIITSFIEKKSGKDWVVPNSSIGLGQYMNERFTLEQSLDFTLKYQNKRAMGIFGLPKDQDWPHPGIYKPGMISDSIVPYRAVSPKKGSLKIIDNGLVQTAILEMSGDEKNHFPATELHIRLEAGAPYVDIECTIKDKNKDNWPEADWLCLPFNIKEPKFTVERALGSFDPATDILPGANRHLFAVGPGVTITDSDGSGVSVTPIDHPLVSLGQPGIWKFSNDFVPKDPVVYLNLYNNMWNTNFRYWYPGTWSSRVRIQTFSRETHTIENFRISSLESRLPFFTAVATGKGGELPSEAKGITSSRKGVVITAFNTTIDNKEQMLLRVWEQTGNSGELTISIPTDININQAQPINIRGEKIGNRIPISKGKLRFDLGKYTPATFILLP